MGIHHQMKDTSDKIIKDLISVIIPNYNHERYLAERIERLSESETLAMTRMSRELTAKGFDVINLSIGQPDFNTPENIKDAAKEALDQNYTTYTPVSGYPDLRKAISEKCNFCFLI